MDMNIVFVSDDNLSTLVSVTIKSILENKRKEDNLHFYYVGYQISEKSKNYLTQLVTSYNDKLTFIDAPDYCLELAGDVVTAKVIYCYCYLQDILPKEIEKVLLLESDMLVLGSLDKLYSTDITNYYVAATDDMQSKWYNRKLGLGDDVSYFNSGMMLLNLKKIREDNITPKVTELLKNGKAKFCFDVQDELNVVFDGGVKIIPPKYNCTSSFTTYSYKNMMLYRHPTTRCTYEEFIEARKHPVVLHFTRNQLIQPKPWVEGCEHPYKDKYLKYREHTVEKNIPFRKGKFTIKRKILGILYQYLPKRMTAFVLGNLRSFWYPVVLYRFMKHN